MALIVEDGSGLIDAESYISVADADTYIQNRTNDASWTGASVGDKEKALRIGTEYLDSKYGPIWKGHRTNNIGDQRLDWPRSGVVDYDGGVFVHDELPEVLENATVEAALRHINAIILQPDITSSSPGDIVMERDKVGPLEVEVRYDSSGKTTVPKFFKVDALIAELILGGRPGAQSFNIRG